MNDKHKTYYIGQIAKDLGLSQRTVRYYEELGFIKPSRTDGGFRTYSERDVDLIRMVIRFKDLGMRLDEIRTLLLPSEHSLTNETMAQLKEALEARRNDFDKKIDEYKESVKQINRILKILSKCVSCGEPNTEGTCEQCLKTREERGEHVELLIASLLPDEHTEHN